MTEREILKKKKRIVVKIGTSSLTFPNGKINYQRIERLVRVLSEIQADGRQVILVSSGAVAVGSGRMGIDQVRYEIWGSDVQQNRITLLGVDCASLQDFRQNPMRSFTHRPTARGFVQAN